jgi:hypothetical protein
MKNKNSSIARIKADSGKKLSLKKVYHQKVVSEVPMASKKHGSLPPIREPPPAMEPAPEIYELMKEEGLRKKRKSIREISKQIAIFEEDQSRKIKKASKLPSLSRDLMITHEDRTSPKLSFAEHHSSLIITNDRK